MPRSLSPHSPRRSPRGSSPTRGRSPSRNDRRDDRPFSKKPIHSRDDPQYSIYVGGLSDRMRADDLREVFTKFGELKDIYMPRDYHSGRFKGFAYIEFARREGADAAIREMNDKTLHGKTIQVTMAQGRRKTPNEMRAKSGGGGGGGGGGRRRGGRSRSPPRRRRGYSPYDRDRRRRSRSPDSRSPSPRGRSSRSPSRHHYGGGGSRRRSISPRGRSPSPGGYRRSYRDYSPPASKRMRRDSPSPRGRGGSGGASPSRRRVSPSRRSSSPSRFSPVRSPPRDIRFSRSPVRDSGAVASSSSNNSNSSSSGGSSNTNNSNNGNGNSERMPSHEESSRD